MKLVFVPWNGWRWTHHLYIYSADRKDGGCDAVLSVWWSERKTLIRVIEKYAKSRRLTVAHFAEGPFMAVEAEFPDDVGESLLSALKRLSSSMLLEVSIESAVDSALEGLEGGIEAALGV